MNRREFLKFLGGAAAAAAVAPEVLADAVSSGNSGWSGATGVQGPIGPPGPIGPQCPFGPVVLEPGMTVQQAIDSLPAEGGTVLVPSGTYIVNEAITIPDGVEIVCEGNISIIGCHIIGAPRRAGDAPITFLMEEEDQVQIVGNVIDSKNNGSMGAFYVPIGEALTSLRRKFSRFLNALRSG